MKNVEKELAQDVVSRAEKIVETYEAGDKDAAAELWRELDASVPNREELSDEDLDLMIEFELLFDGTGAGDIGSVKKLLEEAKMELETV